MQKKPKFLSLDYDRFFGVSSDEEQGGAAAEKNTKEAVEPPSPLQLASRACTYYCMYLCKNIVLFSILKSLLLENALREMTMVKQTGDFAEVGHYDEDDDAVTEESDDSSSDYEG